MITIPKICMIAALGINNGIGKNNDLLWHLPKDMEWFKQKTRDHVVVMGRKTFDSLPPRYCPLPNRPNIVISRSPQMLETKDLYWIPALDQGLDKAKTIAQQRLQGELFIIGGGDLYKQILPEADRLYLTEVNDAPDADSFFPAFNRDEWARQVISTHEAENDQPGFVIAQYDRL